MAEDDDGDIDGAEDGELVRLLEQAALALEEGDGPGRGVSRDVWEEARRRQDGIYLLRSSRMGLI